MSHEKGQEKNSGTRRKFTAEEKATILRRHLADKIPVSDLCEEYKIQPSLFYVWQRQAFENLGVALEDRRTGSRNGTDNRESATQKQQEKQHQKQQQETIERLEAKLQKKDSIIAFVSEEHLALKKKLGES